MLYSGPAFSVTALGDGLVELKFDLAGESVNKLSKAALQDFDAATQAIAKDKSVQGVVVTSGKAVFIVGADITEFGAMFAAGEESIAKNVIEVNRMLSRFEDLPVPTVAAINGVCLGGGLELALACDYRVMSTAASVGFPEVKLGIFPGFGGSRAHAARDRHRQRGRVDLLRQRQEGRRGAEGRRGGRRRRARAAARCRDRDGEAGHRGPARLEGEARREARAGEAQQDRADDGVQLVARFRVGAGRPELSGADAGDQEHAGIGRARVATPRSRSRASISRRPRSRRRPTRWSAFSSPTRW